MTAPPHARVAIVSDPLVQRGGAERVVEILAATFPQAPVYALVYSRETGPASIAARVIPSWLDRIPGARTKHRMFFPLYASAIESFDLRSFDVIISSHHTVAKGLLRRAGQRHICYCHTPMRALWERPFDEVASLPGPVRPGVTALFGAYRMWDYATAARVDEFIANSRVTQQRIAQHYGRESVLVHPPIDTERFTPGGSAGDYFLIASRRVPYKRIDIAVDAAKAAGARTIVVGGGVEPADGPVEYRGHVDDAELVRLMRGAKALLFPQEEDFGMTPLEMNACGRPVIAYAAGGALETVVDGVTGVLVPHQDIESFAAAIARFDHTAFDPARLREHAQTFGIARFTERMRDLVYAS